MVGYLLNIDLEYFTRKQSCFIVHSKLIVEPYLLILNIWCIAPKYLSVGPVRNSFYFFRVFEFWIIYSYPFPAGKIFKIFLCQVWEVNLQGQDCIKTLAEFSSFPFPKVHCKFCKSVGKIIVRSQRSVIIIAWRSITTMKHLYIVFQI